VRLARKIYAADHPNLADALGGQADAFAVQGRFDEAIAVREEALRINRTNGDQDGVTFALNSLGILYLDAGRPDLAIARAEEALELGKKNFGPGHERTGELMANLARSYAAAKRPEQADSMFRASIEVFDGLDDRGIFAPLANMDYASLCRDTGRMALADSFYTRAEAALDSTNAGTRMYLGACLIEHAYLRSLQDRHPEAEAMMQSAFPMRVGENAKDPSLAGPYMTWAAARVGAGDADGAIEKLALASACGGDESGAARFPELAQLRTRPDYPLSSR
jgi:tetratricopeptide (TPR) repeat protein